MNNSQFRVNVYGFDLTIIQFHILPRCTYMHIHAYTCTPIHMLGYTCICTVMLSHVHTCQMQLIKDR